MKGVSDNHLTDYHIKLVMRKVIDVFLEIVFLISMVLLGKFEGNISKTALLPSYQIVVTIFLASGVLRFGLLNNDKVAFFWDSIKSLIVSIIVIPAWYSISGQMSNDIFEPICTIVHFVFLMVILILTSKSEKLSGKVAYFTHAVIPIIAIILIKLGIPVVLSVIIGVILPEPINYCCFIRKQR